jgi:DNA-binding NarL/FixJ family response regulator
VYDVVQQRRLGREAVIGSGPGAAAPTAGEAAVLRVAICERTALFRESLAGVVAGRGHQVVCCLGDLADVLWTIEDCRPDVLLLDASLTDRESLARLHERRRNGLATRVLLLTASDEDACATAAVDLGLADGVLHRAVDLGTLERALTGRLTATRRPRRTVVRPRRPDSSLTAREREVIGLLLAGRSTDSIALALGVSRSTVHSHVQSILRKLGAQNRVEAVSTYLSDSRWQARPVLSR